MDYKIKATITIALETTLNDEEIPTKSTIEFLLSEDLQDVGYDIESVKCMEIKIKPLSSGFTGRGQKLDWA